MVAADALSELIRLEGARLLATLVRSVGDLSVAEEAVQEASIAALGDWDVHGLPREPRAWLTTTARRKAVDIIRRERLRSGKEQAGAELMKLLRPDEPDENGTLGETVLRDDLLRLIFTCCHPSIAPEARLALALKTLCQLSVAQVAAALLSTEAAITKRLTRTRQKIAVAKIPYRVPEDAELPGRLVSVCGVVHALYTAGHTPVNGNAVLDVDLCLEAVRLARLLHELLPDEPQPSAVLALLLLSEARRPARLADNGEPVRLPDQDRVRWDAGMIREGVGLLADSLRRTEGMADPFQLQAAITYEHDRAASYAETDWDELLRLYDLLLSVAPSAPAALSRAVVIAERDGANAGLAALAGLRDDPRVAAIRSELLARTGRFAEAAASAQLSLAGELNERERAYRERRRTEWLALAG